MPPMPFSGNATTLGLKAYRNSAHWMYARANRTVNNLLRLARFSLQNPFMSIALCELMRMIAVAQAREGYQDAHAPANSACYMASFNHGTYVSHDAHPLPQSDGNFRYHLQIMFADGVSELLFHQFRHLFLTLLKSSGFEGALENSLQALTDQLIWVEENPRRGPPKNTTAGFRTLEPCTEKEYRGETRFMTKFFGPKAITAKAETNEISCRVSVVSGDVYTRGQRVHPELNHDHNILRLHLHGMPEVLKNTTQRIADAVIAMGSGAIHTMRETLQAFGDFHETATRELKDELDTLTERHNKVELDARAAQHNEYELNMLTAKHHVAQQDLKTCEHAIMSLSHVRRLELDHVEKSKETAVRERSDALFKLESCEAYVQSNVNLLIEFFNSYSLPFTIGLFVFGIIALLIGIHKLAQAREMREEGMAPRNSFAAYEAEKAPRDFSQTKIQKLQFLDPKWPLADRARYFDEILSRYLAYQYKVKGPLPHQDTLYRTLDETLNPLRDIVTLNLLHTPFQLDGQVLNGGTVSDHHKRHRSQCAGKMPGFFTSFVTKETPLFSTHECFFDTAMQRKVNNTLSDTDNINQLRCLHSYLQKTDSESPAPAKKTH
jgi:hypothetical protein